MGTRSPENCEECDLGRHYLTLIESWGRPEETRLIVEARYEHGAGEALNIHCPGFCEGSCDFETLIESFRKSRGISQLGIKPVR